jgi:hypothetical protein
MFPATSQLPLVMSDLVGRLLLLFLLGVDWAADPELLAPAVQALAAPMASTECCCPSLSYRHDIRSQSDAVPQPTVLAEHTSLTAVGRDPCGLRTESHAVCARTDVRYVFMCILR